MEPPCLKWSRDFPSGVAKEETKAVDASVQQSAIARSFVDTIVVMRCRWRATSDRQHVLGITICDLRAVEDRLLAKQLNFLSNQSSNGGPSSKVSIGK